MQPRFPSSIGEKVEMLIKHDTDLVKKITDTVTVDYNGENYVFNIGKFWDNISANFYGGKSTTALTDAQKKRCREGLDGLERRVEAAEAARAERANIA